jgi:hypothetical protein
MEEPKVTHQSSIPATFKEVQELYKMYQNNHEPQNKTMIIVGLSKLMNDKVLTIDDKKEAIEIDNTINAANLKARLEKYETQKHYGTMSTLPEDVVKIIIDYVAQGASLVELHNLLLVNKSFNMALLKAPVNLDLSFHTELNDEKFGKIIALFPRMESLNISHTKLTKEGLRYLISLKNLKGLNMSRLSLDDTDAELISNHLSNLEYLFLDSTSITDNGLKHLGKLKNLKTLSLISCPNITEKAVDDFRKAFPHIKVEHQLDQNMFVLGHNTLTFGENSNDEPLYGDVLRLYFGEYLGLGDTPVINETEEHNR